RSQLLLVSASVASTLPSFLITHPASSVIYALSLHDALPIYPEHRGGLLHASLDLVPGNSRRLERKGDVLRHCEMRVERVALEDQDRKSTRLNSSHLGISYAVFCLKKKIQPNRLARPKILL